MVKYLTLSLCISLFKADLNIGARMKNENLRSEKIDDKMIASKITIVITIGRSVQTI